MKPMVLVAIFAGALIPFAVAQAPLRPALSALALERTGISYREATGTVWKGRVAGIVWNGRRAGDASVEIDPWNLIRGSLSARLEATDGPIEGHINVSRSILGSVRLTDGKLSADVAALPTMIPLTGRFEIAAEDLAFSAEGCRVANVRLSTDALVRGLPGVAWSGPALSGNAACDGRDLVLPLTSTDPNRPLQMTMRVHPEGRYAIDAVLPAANPGLDRALPLLGFTRQDGQFRLTQEGRWR